MRAPDRFEFSTTPRDHREAMMAGAQSLLIGTNRFVWSVMGIVMTALVSLGGAAVAALLCNLIGADPSIWMFVGLLLAGLFYLTHQGVLYNIMASTSAQRPFAQGAQTIFLDDAGMTLETGAARWHTPWFMIDDVRRTKHTVALCVGGISFAIPHSAIGPKAEVDQLLSDIQAQIDNA